MLKIYRCAHFLHRMKVPFLPSLLYMMNRIVFSVVLPPSASIGKRVLFGYYGLGTVIHARSVIGNDVVIGTNVTVGGRNKHYDVPKIGDHVSIGSGAKILGPIVIGDFSDIGANAVVLHDVPKYAIVAGVPARVIRIKNNGI